MSSKLLSKKTLISILYDKCSYRRVSFKGLETTNPVMFGAWKRLALGFEDYESLTFQENYCETLDDDFLFFLNTHRNPIVIPNMDLYTEDIYKPLFENLNLEIGSEEMQTLCSLHLK